nr:hypothetical protein [Saccharomonospora xinjiangensis]
MVTEFLYDADGQRLLRRDPDGATLYLEGQELRWDRESGETTTTRYYSFGDSTVAMRTEAGVTWLLGDHQGTSRFAVDAQSMQVTRHRGGPGSSELPTEWPTSCPGSGRVNNRAAGGVTCGGSAVPAVPEGCALVVCGHEGVLQRAGTHIGVRELIKWQPPKL